MKGDYMDKKTRNIIAIIISVLLVLGIILTIHFAREDGSRDFRINDFQRREYSERENNGTKGKKIPNFPNRKSDTIKEETTEEDEVKDSKIISDESKPNKPSCDNYRINDIDFDSVVNRGGTFSTKYMILLSIGTFLLGGSIMYLVMNNISKEEKKTKKK